MNAEDSSRQELTVNDKKNPDKELEPRFKLRKSLTTKFREFVPKSADVDDLLFDLEKGKKSSEDYGDISGTQKKKK